VPPLATCCNGGVQGLSDGAHDGVPSIGLWQPEPAYIHRPPLRPRGLSWGWLVLLLGRWDLDARKMTPDPLSRRRTKP
jgi:hypothetical protein